MFRLIVGLMGTTTGDSEGVYHWIALLTILVFGVGILASALTMLTVTLVSVKEAHGAENGLKRFVDGETDRNKAMFTAEPQIFRLADFATFAGAVSAVGFMLGGLISLILLTLFF